MLRRRLPRFMTLKNVRDWCIITMLAGWTQMDRFESPSKAITSQCLIWRACYLYVRRWDVDRPLLLGPIETLSSRGRIKPELLLLLMCLTSRTEGERSAPVFTHHPLRRQWWIHWCIQNPLFSLILMTTGVKIVSSYPISQPLVNWSLVLIPVCFVWYVYVQTGDNRRSHEMIYSIKWINKSTSKFSLLHLM